MYVHPSEVTFYRNTARTFHLTLPNLRPLSKLLNVTPLVTLVYEEYTDKKTKKNPKPKPYVDSIEHTLLFIPPTTTKKNQSLSS